MFCALCAAAAFAEALCRCILLRYLGAFGEVGVILPVLLFILSTGLLFFFGLFVAPVFLAVVATVVFKVYGGVVAWVGVRFGTGATMAATDLA